ncbi:MAG: MobA/MobL family protein [Accumulibacter sp.]|uniref:MobA/MobL family protein n=1 Tax=Accumulibacter sp. TaxID=2053492 RepID=UPI0033158328
MASYHCSVKVGGKGKASGHAAYIAREGHYAERAGYEDLEATGHGNLPAWAEGEPALFWAAADRYERANGASYREIEIALPRELNPAQRQALVLDFIRQEIGERHAHQWAIHNPGAALAGGEQPHAHLMYSERTVDGIERDPEQYFKRYNGKHPELGGCRKDSAGTEERLLETRQRWAEVQNAHLQQHGHAARVDHRSLADQGIDRAPEQHLGGRRVRQLAPEQREALLERREAENELLQSQRELAPFDFSQHLHALTAAAQQREQDEQAARMAEARAYCQQALSEFRAELAQKAEQERALEAERERLQRLEAERERERPQRPEPEQAPLLEPLPAIGLGSPAFVERLQAALAETMEQLQAQREQSPAQEPPSQRSRGFDMEP